MARIIERTEASGVGADDYVLLCSPTLGERKFKAIDLVPSEATLIEKTITENGEYNAEDDEADGYSKINVNVQGGGGGDPVKIQYLAYAKFEDEDPGIDGFIFPLDVKEYDGYSEYLSYDSTNKCFTVLKDFTAILVPWVINYKNGAHEAQLGIKLNNNYILQTINSTTTSVDSPGNIINNTNFTTAPSELNGIYISLHINDTLSLAKPRDYGWSHVYLKIYKLFNSTNKSDNFMSSVVNLWDTSNYQSVIVSDDSEISPIVYHYSNDRKICVGENTIDGTCTWYFMGYYLEENDTAPPEELLAYLPADDGVLQSENYVSNQDLTQNGWCGFYNRNLRLWTLDTSGLQTGYLWGVVNTFEKIGTIYYPQHNGYFEPD